MVSLLQLLFVQLDLGIMLLSHLMQGLSQLVLVLNLTPRIHLYQASFMLSSGFVNLLGRKNDIKPSYLTNLPWLISRPSEVFTYQPPHVCSRTSMWIDTFLPSFSNEEIFETELMTEMVASQTPLGILCLFSVAQLFISLKARNGWKTLPCNHG